MATEGGVPPMTEDAGTRQAPGWLVALLVGLSGFTSLVYQVVWERSVRYNFGGDSVSSAIVTATFVLGLGVGALVFGRWRRRPFAVLALVELAIGTYAIVSYHVLAPLAVVLGRALGGVSVSAEGLRLPVVVGCIVFLLPPCILIGGTLPLIFNCFVRPGAYRSRTVGLLYGLNTVGAAAGTLAAPFVFLNRVSIPATLLIAGLGNLMLGVAIWLCGRRAGPLGGDDPEEVGASAEEATPLPLLFGLAFVSGLIALSFEVSLFRAFAVLNPSSPYNFPVVLTPFLATMALGSVVLTRFSRDSRARSLRRIGLLFILSVGSMLFGVVVSAALSRRGFHVVWRRQGTLSALLLYSLVLAAPLPFLLGGVFPLLLRLAARTGRNLPRSTGLIYLVNATGAFAGAMLTQFVGFPRLGTRGVLTALSVLGVLAGTWCWARGRPDRGQAVRYALLAAVVVATLGLVPTAVWDVHTFGIIAPDVDRVEGVTGVALIEWHPFGGAVFVNGQYMSLLPDDRRHVRLASFALVLPRRQRVLVLGFGGGAMVRDVVGDPGVDVVDAVDWSYELPVLLEGPRARRALAGGLRHPKVRLCRCDARVVVSLYEPGSFDVVIDNLAETSWVGATGVKSVTYFGEVRRVLRPSGVLVYHGNYANAREAVLATLATAFPVVLEHEQGVVLASGEPIPIDRDRAERVLAPRARLLGIQEAPYTAWLLRGLRPISLDGLAGAAPIRDDLLIHEYRHDPLRDLWRRWRAP